MTWEGWLLGCDNNQAQTWYDAEDLSKGWRRLLSELLTLLLLCLIFSTCIIVSFMSKHRYVQHLRACTLGTTVNVPTVAWVRMLLVHAKQVFWVEVPTLEAFWQMNSSRGAITAMHISIRRVPHVLEVWKYARVMFLIFSLKSVILSAGAVVIVAIVLFSRA